MGIQSVCFTFREPPAGGGWAGPSYVDKGAFAIGSGFGTRSLPAGWAENDILIVFLETNNEAITVTGYTEAGSSPASNSGTNPTRLTVFWKRATSSESDPSISDSGDHQAGQVIAVRGCITTGDPFDVTASSAGGTGTSITIPGATTTGPNRLVIAACSTTRDLSATDTFSSWANSDLANLSERINQTGATGQGGGFGVVTGEKAVAGAYGSTTVTQATSVEWTGWTGALIPA